MAYRVLWTLALVGLLTGCRAIASYPYAEAGGDGGAVDGRADGVARDGPRDVSPRDVSLPEGGLQDAARIDVVPPDVAFPEVSVPDAHVDDALADIAPPLPDVAPPVDVSPPPDVASPVDLPGVVQVPLPLERDCTAALGHWCWANPLPQGNALHDVFCVTSGTRKGECFAVGDGGSLLHRPAAGTWTLLESGTNRDLNAIWVDADTHRIVVAGGSGLIRVSKNHGPGVGWDEVKILGSTRLPNFVALWGEPLGPVYVGSDGPTGSKGIWRWTQGSPATKALWVQIEASAAVQAFWGDGKGMVYAATSDGVKTVDRNTALGYAGSYACSGTPLRDLVGVGNGLPQEFLVLGMDDTVYEVSTALQCSPLVILPTGSASQARGISGVSKSDFYVVGEDSTGRKGYVDHYNISKKLPAGSSDTLFPMTAIASAGPSGPQIAVGKVGEIWEKPSSGVWDSKVTRLAEGKTLGTLAEADALYAGGDGGTLLKLGSGGTWTKWPPTMTLGNIRGLSGQKASGGGSPAELWAVDSGTYLQKLLPGSGSTTTSGLQKLSAVQDFVKGSDPRIIVGGYEMLAVYFPASGHWESFSASAITALAEQTITSLWSPDGQSLYFVARFSPPAPSSPTYALYYGKLANSSPLKEQPFGSLTDPVYRVVGAGSMVYALGGGQVAWKSAQSGGVWASVATMPSEVGTRAIWGLARESSGDNLWVVGERGIVLSHSGGSLSWTLGESRCRQQLRDVAVYGTNNNQKVWAVGSGGAIIYRTLP